MFNKTKTDDESKMFQYAPNYAHRLVRSRREDRIALVLAWLYVAATTLAFLGVMAGGR